MLVRVASPQVLLGTHCCFIGTNRVGKTSLLVKYFEKYRDIGFSVVVMDAAARHRPRSLEAYLSNFVTLNTADELDKSTLCLSVVALDVARFIEPLNDAVEKKCIALYQAALCDFKRQQLKLFHQLMTADAQRLVVLMDEVPLIADAPSNWSICARKKNVFFVCAVHEYLQVGTQLSKFEYVYDFFVGGVVRL